MFAQHAAASTYSSSSSGIPSDEGYKHPLIAGLFLATAVVQQCLIHLNVFLSLGLGGRRAFDRQGELLDLPLPRFHVVREVDVNLQQLLLQSVVSGPQEVDCLHAGLDRPHMVFLKCTVRRTQKWGGGGRM